MAKIEKFEDLICWQKARELVKKIYKLTNSDKISKDFVLKDQLRRAAISIMLNIQRGLQGELTKIFQSFYI